MIILVLSKLRWYHVENFTLFLTSWRFLICSSSFVERLYRYTIHRYPTTRRTRWRVTPSPCLISQLYQRCSHEQCLLYALLTEARFNITPMIWIWPVYKVHIGVVCYHAWRQGFFPHNFPRPHHLLLWPDFPLPWTGTLTLKVPLNVRWALNSTSL